MLTHKKRSEGSVQNHTPCYDVGIVPNCLPVFRSWEDGLQGQNGHITFIGQWMRDKGG